MASKDTSDVPSKEKLAELITVANLQYSLKNYSTAADLFSEATELQAEINGEMAPENAELLYRYGRCLYKVAVAKSDVLGGKVAAEEKNGKSKKTKKNKAESSGSASKANGAEGLPSVTEESAHDDKEEKAVENKPYFQLIGDENWDTDSESGDDPEGEAGAEEGEDDDFANAYEILDVGRVLLSRQLEALSLESTDGSAQNKGKGKSKAPTEESPEVRLIKERLADTHDLQAEISLENERFVDAISDSRAALELRKQLHPQESSLIAEGHYKLSLALEFASVTAVREAQREQDAGPGGKPEEAQVDMELREEAAVEMEAAITSLALRTKKEESELPNLPAEKKEEQQKSIADAKEMIEEMKQRVSAHMSCSRVRSILQS
jgi:HAT1-interacting factor 1